ncbi:hydrogenase maturation protease [Thioalkalivibrio sp.]|uniref:hydrogenase maturation protease n=1 Tax=Thioalkalivibrio sp. TaxID=2093813 RepID=UPI00356B1C11
MTRDDPNRRWRIIGVGSPVTGDDLGWRAIEALRAAGLDRCAELLALDRPGPALLEYLQPDGAVILIDAMEAGLPPGSIRELRLDELVRAGRMPSSHDFGVADALALAQALKRLPRRLHVLGLQASDGAGTYAWRRDRQRELLQQVRAILDLPDPA